MANTIQVAAYSKRREVAVMKLVGASNWFIQMPFVLEAVFAGLIGAIIAFVTLVLAKIFIIDGSLKPLTTLLTPVAWHTIWLHAADPGRGRPPCQRGHRLDHAAVLRAGLAAPRA